MPVTFQTQSHPRVIQLDHVAKSLLQMMGHGGGVPGALRADEVAQAAARLRDALDQLRQQAKANDKAEQGTADDDDQPRHVPVAQRAKPLLELLDAALAGGDHVMWE